MDIKKYIKEHSEILGIMIDNKLYIKNATNTGYLEAELYDGIDLSFIGQNKKRGRVQKQITNTITCSGVLGVVVC